MPSPLLKRLGLDRPELRAWAMYDWANSAMVTTIVTAVFPIYFARVAAADLPPAERTFQLASATTIGLAIIALLSPILGVIADHAGVKKRLLAVFMVIGVGAVSLMFGIEQGEWRYAAVLFIVANIAVNGSFVFYDAFLPHLARDEREMNRVSTAGYALGYVGGGLLLALNLAWIQKPEWFGLPHGEGLTPSQATLPTRLAFLSVAVWWLVFSIPLFRRVPEPPPTAQGKVSLSGAFTGLVATFKKLGRYRQAVLMLVAFLIYNDGIGTIIRMAAAYGTEIGIGQTALIASIMIVQFVGIPCSFLFGAFAERIGTKQAIFIGLLVYCGISVLGYYMTTALHFLILALLVGVVQGGTQALSRSLFASMIPRRQSAEFFGFFAVVEKFAGIFGPAVFAPVIRLTGSSRLAILAIASFFLVGGWLLARVDVAAGQAAVAAENLAA